MAQSTQRSDTQKDSLPLVNGSIHRLKHILISSQFQEYSQDNTIKPAH